MTTHLLIPTDLEADPTYRDEPLPLDYLQRAVGGFVQAVYLDGAVMWLNEEGKLNNLSWNIRAQVVARGRLFPGDRIVGNVVITGPADAEGNPVDLPWYWVQENLHEAIQFIPPTGFTRSE